MLPPDEQTMKHEEVSSRVTIALVILALAVSTVCIGERMLTLIMTTTEQAPFGVASARDGLGPVQQCFSRIMTGDVLVLALVQEIDKERERATAEVANTAAQVSASPAHL